MNRLLQRIAAADCQTNGLREDFTDLRALLTEQFNPFEVHVGARQWSEVARQLNLEIEQFEEVSQFPFLAQKAIVGVGGAFSAGKSSLINALLGKHRLHAEVDPTTAIPTYLVRGQQDGEQQGSITALTRKYAQLTLSEDEFASLTHDAERGQEGPASTLLHSILIEDADFEWPQIALLDTPGYSNSQKGRNGRTDEYIAHTQLNDVNIIIWVVSAEGGVISEADIAFLKRLNEDIPKLIVINRADKKSTDDITRIVEITAQTLKKKKIAVLDILTVSARKPNEFEYDKLKRYFNQWNHVPAAPRIVSSLMDISQGLAEALPSREIKWQYEAFQQKFFRQLFIIAKKNGWDVSREEQCFEQRQAEQQAARAEMKLQQAEEDQKEKAEVARFELMRQVKDLARQVERVQRNEEREAAIAELSEIDDKISILEDERDRLEDIYREIEGKNTWEQGFFESDKIYRNRQDNESRASTRAQDAWISAEFELNNLKKRKIQLSNIVSGKSKSLG